MLRLAVAVAILSGSTALAGEVGVAGLTSHVGLGYGYNPTIGEFFSPCIDVPAGNVSSAYNSAVNQPSEVYEVRQVTSRSQLRSALQINAYASAFSASGSLRADYKRLMESDFAQEKDYFFVSVKVDGLTYPLTGPLKLNDAGLRALKRSHAFFRKYCGDSYITALRGGGEFSALIVSDKLTTNEAKELDASLKAGLGTMSAGASSIDAMARLSAEKKLQINVAVSGSTGEALTSFTDLSAMLERARTFANSLKQSKATSSIRVAVFEKYTSSVDFGVALDEANSSAFDTFDGSSFIISSLMSSFDLATERLAQVRDALNRKSEYNSFDEGEAKKIEVQLAEVKDKLASKIQECAGRVKAGEVCVESMLVGTVIPSLPATITRLEPCNISQFRQTWGALGNTCNSVRRIGGQCRCVECSMFQDGPYSKSAEDICVGMPANVPLIVSLSTRIRVSPNAADHWLAASLNGKEVINQGNLLGNASDIDRMFDQVASQSGEFRARLNVEHCQSNVKQIDTCTLEKVAPRNALVRVRTRDPF